MGPFWGFRGAARPKSSQAAQKGPDARRRAPRPPRRTLCTLRGAAALANEADGPFSAACLGAGEDEALLRRVLGPDHLGLLAQDLEHGRAGIRIVARLV